jgi:hypothetical protein
MKKTVSQVVMIIGALVAIIGILIDCFNYGAMEFGFGDLTTVAAVVAVAFVFSKKDSLVYVGFLIAAILGAYSIPQISSSIPMPDGYGDVYFVYYTSVARIGLSVMALSSIMFYFVELLKAFGWVKSSAKSAEAGDVMIVLNKYKDMEKENIITAEEFDALKSKILKGAEKEVTSVEDLKKWKKLFDQKVITEEEFANVKGKIFSK